MTLRELGAVANGIDYEGILWDYLETQPGGDEDACAEMRRLRKEFPTFEARRLRVLSQFGDWSVEAVSAGDGEILVKLGRPGGPQ